MDNDWTAWARDDPGRIVDRSDADVACDHYRRFGDDLRQLGSMAHNAHRLSVEWSRIEPREGVFDDDALRHYREVLDACIAAGMEPIVTLHHFTLPRWLAANGGVMHPQAPRFFARFAARCGTELGPRARYWLTINEPAVLAVMGYLYGVWPPGRRSLRLCFAAMKGMLRMHAAAAAALRAVAAARGIPVRVSIAHAERPQRPARRWSPADHALAVLPNWLFNRWFLRSCMAGRCLPPVGRGETVIGLRGALDFLGVNYYAEDVVRADRHSPHTLFARQMADPSLPLSAFGWAIDPAAMRRALGRLWRDFRLPLLITENGVADDHDELRPQFILDHLHAVLDAAGDGADILGYLHWTAWDNFEWAEGYTKRFGLFSIEPGSLERHAKPSAYLFEAVARSRALPGRRVAEAAEAQTAARVAGVPSKGGSSG